MSGSDARTRGAGRTRIAARHAAMFAAEAATRIVPALVGRTTTVATPLAFAVTVFATPGPRTFTRAGWAGWAAVRSGA